MQEVEIEKDFDCKIIKIPGYVLELEDNQDKKRVGVYIKENLKFLRRTDLEVVNTHEMVIDIECRSGITKRLINLYRSFNPIGHSAKNFFIKQVDLISQAFDNNTVMMGDFNLDYNKINDINYSYANFFDEFALRLGALNLVQLVNFDTWSRMVGTNLRSSCLDHIYVKNDNIVTNVTHLRPCFGDHELVMVHLPLIKPPPSVSIKRNWCDYSPESLCLKLASVDWSNDSADVQVAWNDFENKLITIVDSIAPMSKFSNSSISNLPNKCVMRKRNLRKRLLKHFILRYYQIQTTDTNLLFLLGD